MLLIIACLFAIFYKMPCIPGFYGCKTFPSGKTRQNSCSRIGWCFAWKHQSVLAQLQKHGTAGKEGKWKCAAATWYVEADSNTLLARDWKKHQMAKCNMWSRNKVEKQSRGWSRKDVILKISNMLKTEVQLYLHHRSGCTSFAEQNHLLQRWSGIPLAVVASCVQGGGTTDRSRSREELWGEQGELIPGVESGWRLRSMTSAHKHSNRQLVPAPQKGRVAMNKSNCTVQLYKNRCKGSYSSIWM